MALSRRVELRETRGSISAIVSIFRRGTNVGREDTTFPPLAKRPERVYFAGSGDLCSRSNMNQEMFHVLA